MQIADAELRVMKLIWQNTQVTAREAAKELYGTSGNSEIATVQKLLQRLEAKRLISRDRSQHVHRFSATVTQTAFAGQQFELMAQKLTEGSVVPFIMHLVRAKRISKKEREELRQLLDEAGSLTPARVRKVRGND